MSEIKTRISNKSERLSMNKGLLKQLPFLEEIQANILEPHRRKHVMCLFINFKPETTPFNFTDEMDKFEKDLEDYKDDNSKLKTTLKGKLKRLYLKNQLENQLLLEKLNLNSREIKRIKNEIKELKKRKDDKQRLNKIEKKLLEKELLSKREELLSKRNYALSENRKSLMKEIKKSSEEDVIQEIISHKNSQKELIQELRLLASKEIIEIESKIIGQKEIRNWISDFADKGFENERSTIKIKITNALEQLDKAVEYRTSIDKEEAYQDSILTSFYLTKGLYDKLNINGPVDSSFQSGADSINAPMKLDSPELQKSDGKKWADNRNQIHAMILLANNDLNKLEEAKDLLEEELRGVGQILFFEKGMKLDEGREHFGFKDGLSQPEYFVYNKEEEKYNTSPTLNRVLEEDNRVQKEFEEKLRLALVQENEGCCHLKKEWSLNSIDSETDRFGSYLVFLKLEQNMENFKKMMSVGEKGIKKMEQIIGRKRSTGGTLNGLKCPMNAHVKKVNPREKRPLESDADLVRHKNDPALISEEGKNFIDSEKKRIIRRGIPYNYKKNGGALKPENDSGAGLLFISFQASIKYQFEYILRNWSNNPSFPEEGAKVDALIGQSQTGKKNKLVTYRGMKYFYAPSIPFLMNMKFGVGLPAITPGNISY